MLTHHGFEIVIARYATSQQATRPQQFAYTAIKMDSKVLGRHLERQDEHRRSSANHPRRIVMPVLVDSNVILDVVSQDARFLEWSQTALEHHAASGLMANAMIYAELCCNAKSSAEVDALLDALEIKILEIPRSALFLAGQAHVAYQRRGGSRSSGLPDFFIGAHAEVTGMPLLTRDLGRYRTYFPTVTLIHPDTP